MAGVDTRGTNGSLHTHVTHVQASDALHTGGNRPQECRLLCRQSIILTSGCVTRGGDCFFCIRRPHHSITQQRCHPSPGEGTSELCCTTRGGQLRMGGRDRRPGADVQAGSSEGCRIKNNNNNKKKKKTNRCGRLGKPPAVTLGIYPGRHNLGGALCRPLSRVCGLGRSECSGPTPVRCARISRTPSLIIRAI